MCIADVATLYLGGLCMGGVTVRGWLEVALRSIRFYSATGVAVLGTHVHDGVLRHWPRPCRGSTLRGWDRLKGRIPLSEPHHAD